MYPKLFEASGIPYGELLDDLIALALIDIGEFIGQGFDLIFQIWHTGAQAWLAGHTVKEAAQIAVEQCSQSILTSGLTFFAATFSVSLVSRMELIGVLCKLISRGALISMAVILLVLPALLVITEPILRKTTFHWLKKPEITEKKA